MKKVSNMYTSIFPWIKDDVAIEFIGKMIAEPVARSNEALDRLGRADFTQMNDEVLTTPNYVTSRQRIGEPKGEINQLYRGKSLAGIHHRAGENKHPI